MSEYIPKAKTKVIKFSSRASVKVREQWYTVEYGEERQIDNFDEVDIEKEIETLTNDCNAVVDKQIDETVRAVLNQK